MRVARKLTIALIAAMSVVLAGYALVEVHRERVHFESHIRRDMLLVGRILSGALASMPPDATADERSRILAFAIDPVRKTSARFVNGRAPAGSPDAPALTPADRERLARGESVFVAGEESKEDRLLMYVPLLGRLPEGDALEISETLVEQHLHVRQGLRDTLLAVFGVALSSALLASILGALFVGRPVGALIQQARAVGQSTKPMRLHLRQRDEMSELANEMNAMCDRLDVADARVKSEIAARIATLEQLRHADRLGTVGKLASGIAHELGTPLNVISGRAQMIESGSLSQTEVDGSARVIRERAQHMAAIIRQLLDFARPRPVHKREQRLAELATQTVNLLRPLAEAQGVKLHLGPAKSDPVVAADGVQVQQALTNLIVNGIQAMSEGGAVEVEVGTSSHPPPADRPAQPAGYAYVAVTDQGPGMDEEVREHVFEPFFTTTDVGQGTGLGLSVSYAIVREHGGWIDVRSTPGVGSRFAVYLPQEPSA